MRGQADNPANAAAVAMRSLHGQSGRVGSNLERTQPRVPRRLASELIGLFHSTTFANFVGITQDGLQGQGRLGSMVSIFPPWGQRAKIHAALESRCQVQHHSCV